MTLNDLVTRALRRFGVYSSSESISNDDYEFVSDAFTSALSEIEAEGLAVWTIDDTPETYVEAFVDYAAPSFLPAFGVEPTSSREQALIRLKRLISPRWGNVPSQAEYF